MKFLIFLSSLLVLVNSSNAQALSSRNRDSLDLFFKSLEENGKFMGQVEISQFGKINYYRSIGFSNVAANLQAGQNTKYRVGSISKIFTATLLLKAVEEGRIRLDQTIATFFPTIQNAEIITIEQLLTHHSGIHDFTYKADYLEWQTLPKTDSEMISIISAGGSDFEPG